MKFVLILILSFCSQYMYCQETLYKIKDVNSYIYFVKGVEIEHDINDSITIYSSYISDSTFLLRYVNRKIKKLIKTEKYQYLGKYGIRNVSETVQKRNGIIIKRRKKIIVKQLVALYP